MPAPSAPVLRFTGFSPKALAFLKGLKAHNERSWFEERKPLYEEELLAPLRALVDDTTQALKKAKIPIGGDAKRSVFRIYRDVRFSPNKSPYKTHVSAYLSYDGEKSTPGGLYVHVEPGASMIGAAFYNIERPLLVRWRAEMARDPARFAKVVRAIEKSGRHIVGPADLEDSLARMPRGFEELADSALAPYFRVKSFLIRETLTDADVGGVALVDRIVSLAKDARPLLEYGWSLE